MGLIRRRWKLTKYSLVTGRPIEPEAPENAGRRYWRHRTAVAEALRLNVILRSGGFSQRYYVEKV